MRRSTALATLLVAATAGLVACGGGDGGGGDDTVPADVDLNVVALDGIRWAEEAYTVTAGENVIRLENDSSLPHNLYLVAEDGTRLPEFVEAAARRSASETFDVPAGTYTIICTVPGHQAMQATLTAS